jgi:catechol 2,3-dioxygenase-like lactoylglutathione lyase family enzyme
MIRILVAVAAALLCIAGMAADQFSHPKIYGIAFVRFKATNIEKSSAFYSKILGLKSGHGGCKGAHRPCFAVNPYQYVELIQTGAHEGASFLDEIGFTTSDPPKMREYLSAHLVKTTDTSRGPNGLRFFELQDPEHNHIAFVEPSGVDTPVNARNQVSSRLFHAGFVVKDRVAENKFYSDLLGFRLYWYGGFKDADTDWYEIQVPDGDNWIEYMLNIPPTADHQELGVQNHFSLGVPDIQAAAARLRANGLVTKDAPEVGRDGKWSFDIYDPDANRVEFMEFKNAAEPCCHPYTAPHPKP